MRQAHSHLTVLILSALAAFTCAQMVGSSQKGQYQQCMEQFKLFRRKLLEIRKECPAPLPYSCCQLKETFFDARSGVYVMKEQCNPGKRKTYSYCDMETDGGGWLVIQRRINGTLLFNRTFTEYENGFGDASSEFWYGLKNILCLTQGKDMELQIDLEYPNGTRGFVHYKQFSISGASSYTASTTVFKTSPGVRSDFYNPQKQHYRYGTRPLYQPNFYVRANCGRNQKVGGWWDTSCRGNPNGPGPGQNSMVYAMWNGQVVVKTEIKIRQKSCRINPALQCQYYRGY